MEGTEETAWNKGFSRYYYIPRLGVPLVMPETSNNDKWRTEQSELLKLRQQGRVHPGSNAQADSAGTARKPSSPHGFKPRQHHALQMGKSKFIITTDNESRVRPFD